MTRARPAPLRLAEDPAAAEGLPCLRQSIRLQRAAALLDCDPSHVRQLLKAGHLEGHRIGKRGIRIYVDSLRAYQEARPLAVSRQAAGSDKPPPRPRAGAGHRQATAALKAWGWL